MSGNDVLSSLEKIRLFRARKLKLDRLIHIVRFISQTRTDHCWCLEDESEIESGWRCAVKWVQSNRADKEPELDVMVVQEEDLGDDS
jgi:hypothetical protein